MKEILDCVPYTKYDLFKEKAKKHCGWSNDQYWNRKTGKTKLTILEREVLNEIVAELQYSVPMPDDTSIINSSHDV